MSGVTLTAEQAKLLIPILQQIAGSESSGRRTETPTQHGTPGSSSASSSGGGQFGACHRLSPYVFTNDSAFSTSASETEGGCRYDVEELFHKKKKNTKSTEAQSYVLFTVREAAKVAGIWDTAPCVHDITAEQWRVFTDAISRSCPPLCSQQRLLRDRLADSLNNRRKFLRSTNRKSPLKKKGTRKKLSPLFVDQPTLELEASESQAVNPGDRVQILFKNNIIGEGLVLTEENSMFTRLTLKKIMKNIDNDIPLPEPSASEGKLHFNDLAKMNVFLWRTANLTIIQDGRRSSASGQQSTCTSVKCPRASHKSTPKNNTSNEEGAVSSDESDESDNVSSEDSDDESAEGISEYEKTIEQNRSRNKRILDQIMEGCEDVLPTKKHTSVIPKNSATSKKTKAKAIDRRKKSPGVTVSFGSSSKEDDGKRSELVKLDAKEVESETPPQNVTKSSPLRHRKGRTKPRTDTCTQEHITASTSSSEVVVGTHGSPKPKRSANSRSTKKGQKTQHNWYYEEINSDEDKQNFEPEILDSKRMRKPNTRYT